MLEALAVDLDTAPETSVVVEDTASAHATAHATAHIKVHLAAGLGLSDLLPDDFDLVDVGKLVNVEHVF